MVNFKLYPLLEHFAEQSLDSERHGNADVKTSPISNQIEYKKLKAADIRKHHATPHNYMSVLFV